MLDAALDQFCLENVIAESLIVNEGDSHDVGVAALPNANLSNSSSFQNDNEGDGSNSEDDSTSDENEIDKESAKLYSKTNLFDVSSSKYDCVKFFESVWDEKDSKNKHMCNVPGHDCRKLIVFTKEKNGKETFERFNIESHINTHKVQKTKKF